MKKQKNNLLELNKKTISSLRAIALNEIGLIKGGSSIPTGESLQGGCGSGRPAPTQNSSCCYK